jgi:hypothetical protein
MEADGVGRMRLSTPGCPRESCTGGPTGPTQGRTGSAERSRARLRATRVRVRIPVVPPYTS